MCLQQKTLVRSHLIPSALYDYCWKGEHSPIKFGQGFLMPTDRELQDYLLCSKCEDVLNRGGEAWMADKFATWERTFEATLTTLQLLLVSVWAGGSASRPSFGR